MIDTKNEHSHLDDDFQFDEFDHQESVFDSKPQPMAGAPGVTNTTGGGFLENKNPRKIILIGIIVALVIIVIIYHFATRSNSLDIKNQAPNISQNDVTASQAAGNSGAQNGVVATPNSPAQASKIDALATQVGQIEQTINQQQATIETLQGNISTLQDSINSLNSSVSGMTGQLATAIQHLPKPAPKKVKAQAAVPPPVTYVVKALVPGRAWLQGSDGSALTVAVGNSVPDHGSVTNIDLSAGQVTTSDGTVFSYDTNGN